MTKREDVSMDKEAVDEIKLMEQDEYFAEEQEQHAYLETGGQQNIIYETTSVQHVPEFSGTSHQIHEVVQQSDEEHLSPPKPKERKRKSSWDEVEEHDDNKYFAMSVACSLKRLSTINNLKAKVEIYQVLEKFSSKQEQEKK